MGCSLPGSSVYRGSLGKNTGVGCHALLREIFPTQGPNLDLPHCRWILYCLSYQGSPPGKSGHEYVIINAISICVSSTDLSTTWVSHGHITHSMFQSESCSLMPPVLCFSYCIVPSLTQLTTSEVSRSPLILLFLECSMCGPLPTPGDFTRCSVTKLCPTLCDPMDCSPTDFSVHEISQARILEWVPISFSWGSS